MAPNSFLNGATLSLGWLQIADHLLFMKNSYLLSPELLNLIFLANIYKIELYSKYWVREAIKKNYLGHLLNRGRGGG